MHLSVTDLDQVEEGWPEELLAQLAGFRQAQKILEKRARPRAPQQETGQPIYGMPGARFDPHARQPGVAQHLGDE